MPLYQGERKNQECRVFKDGIPFAPTRSFLVRTHSLAGFNWGYCGSGPAQLALALLLEVTDQDEAEGLYQTFKSEIVAAWGNDLWACTTQGIQGWLKVRRETHADKIARLKYERGDDEAPEPDAPEGYHDE